MLREGCHGTTFSLILVEPSCFVSRSVVMWLSFINYCCRSVEESTLFCIFYVVNNTARVRWTFWISYSKNKWSMPRSIIQKIVVSWNSGLNLSYLNRIIRFESFASMITWPSTPCTATAARSHRLSSTPSSPSARGRGLKTECCASGTCSPAPASTASKLTTAPFSLSPTRPAMSSAWAATTSCAFGSASRVTSSTALVWWEADYDFILLAPREKS